MTVYQVITVKLLLAPYFKVGQAQAVSKNYWLFSHLQQTRSNLALSPASVGLRGILPAQTTYEVEEHMEETKRKENTP